MPTQPTGTVTFLFTDIEGSTRLWEQYPDRMRDVLARHDELLREEIARNDGYVFTTAGDAFSAAFSDPLAGVMAAIDAQRALAAEPWEFGAIKVRMSLHAGVAHERDGDYFGPTLNRTARILSAGHGGQVLLSQATRDLVSGRLPAGVTAQSLGEYRLKDLGSPEQLHQLMHPDLRAEFPGLRTLDAHLNNLPVELSSFIGRRDELAETVKRLADSRLVTLTGVGGSGKTRLALQTAAEVFDDFPNGVWVAQMAGLAEPERFPHWVAEEIEIARSSQAGLTGGGDDRSWMDIVQDYLAPRTSLLVLDNCEHLISSSAEFAERLLRACPNLKILTTSREGLGVRGEYLIQVPSLRLPSVFDDQDADGGYPDAMELFAERASAVNARFALDAETALAVADICRRLDGMPLAIELAAARARMLTVDQISQRLDDAFRLLTGGSRTALPRQQT
ncbi:MAG TPA: adenylate/guanylate cyclase domain-containing protein, partial [Acidimicrobiia bacterium]